MAILCKSKRKMVFASILKTNKFPSTSLPPLPPPPSNPWPSCKNTRRTEESFHVLQNYYAQETANPIHVDTREVSFVTDSSAVCSESLSSSDDTWGVEILPSDRLILEPLDYPTSSILGGKTKRRDVGRKKMEEAGSTNLRESVAIAVESWDPYVDFRASMAEMTVALKLKEWDQLEELLEFYLKVNGEGVHEIICEAFVDLVLEMVCSAL